MEERHGAEHQNADAAKPATADGDKRASGTTAVFDPEKAVKRCFGKQHILQQMIGCFFEQAGPLLEAIRIAFDRGDAEEVRRATHELRNTVAYLAASEAADVAQRVEWLAAEGNLEAAAPAIDELQQQVDRLAAALASHRK